MKPETNENNEEKVEFVTHKDSQRTPNRKNDLPDMHSDHRWLKGICCLLVV